MYKLLTIIIFSLSFSACTIATTAKTRETNNDVKKPTSSVQESLKTHLAQWKKASLTSYSYEFRRSCFCMRDYTKPVLIRVKNNAVVDARFKDNHKPLSEVFKQNKQTINRLFKTIQEAIDRKAYSIKVKYHEQYSYPISIMVDYDKQMADEELYLSAKDLKPL